MSSINLQNEVSIQQARMSDFKYAYYIDLCGPGGDIALEQIQNYATQEGRGRWACDGNWFICEKEDDAMPFKLGWMVA